MRKQILTLGLVAALAIPAGAAMAADDTDDTVVTPVAAQEQVQQQSRLHEPGEYTGQAIQERKQLRLHIDDPAYAEVRAQNQAADLGGGADGFGKGPGAKSGQGGQYGLADGGQGLGLRDGTCKSDES
jgi:hypothetical protein